MGEIKSATSPGYTNAAQEGLKAANKPAAKEIGNVPLHQETNRAQRRHGGKHGDSDILRK